MPLPALSPARNALDHLSRRLITSYDVEVEKKSTQTALLTNLLRIRPGVTAIAGSGGKTSLLRALGRELSKTGHTVILCTTTRFRCFDGIPGGDVADLADVRTLLRREPLIWLGTPAENGKWTAPEIPMEDLCACADHVLVEADGSAGRPLKAHRDFEPVVPAEANQTILVVGAEGFHRPIQDAAHCPELFAEKAQCGIDELVSAQNVARVLLKENLADQVLVNQADVLCAFARAQELARLMPCPVSAGSLRDGKGNHTICSL